MQHQDVAAINVARVKVQRRFKEKGGSWNAQDCFTFLGLAPPTRAQDVQQRFRSLSLVIHPDKVALLPAPIPAECAAKMQQLVAFRDAALQSPLLGSRASAAASASEVRQKCSDCSEFGEAIWMGGSFWLCVSCWQLRKKDIKKEAEANRDARKRRLVEVQQRRAAKRDIRRGKAAEKRRMKMARGKGGVQLTPGLVKPASKAEEGQRAEEAPPAAEPETGAWELRESRSQPGIFFVWERGSGRSVLASRPREAWEAGGDAALEAAGWQRLESRNRRGFFYFFEAASGQTVAEEEAEEEAEEAASAASPSASLLPDGWELRESRSSPGTFYYYSWRTGESRLERPTA